MYALPNNVLAVHCWHYSICTRFHPQPLWMIMTQYKVTLGETSGSWIFGTRERAEAWCEQFGNTFTITEVEDD